MEMAVALVCASALNFMSQLLLCVCAALPRSYRTKRDRESAHIGNSEKKMLAGEGFDPPTFGLWAQHATTALPCF